MPLRNRPLRPGVANDDPVLVQLPVARAGIRRELQIRLCGNARP